MLKRKIRHFTSGFFHAVGFGSIFLFPNHNNFRRKVVLKEYANIGIPDIQNIFCAILFISFSYIFLIIMYDMRLHTPFLIACTIRINA